MAVILLMPRRLVCLGMEAQLDVGIVLTIPRKPRSRLGPFSFGYLMNGRGTEMLYVEHQGYEKYRGRSNWRKLFIDRATLDRDL